VNIDLYKSCNPQIDPDRSVKMVLKRIPNFVLASGEFLPFKSKTFGIVECHHVIEHSDNPIRLLKEVIRVCSGIVNLSCPHRLARQPKKPLHKHFFSCSWFNRTLKNYSFLVTTRTAGHGSLGFLDSLNPLKEIQVTIWLYI